jgi:acyl-CoA thioesterase I
MLCRAGQLFLVAMSMLLAAAPAAQAMPPLRIVAVGASNTHGWYVGKGAAYPALLQTMLKANGVDAHVTNAGVPFDTTAMMMSRLRTDVPDGTDIAILQPGGNDLRFFGTREQRAANIAAMVRQLRARSIEVIVYDETIPLRYYTLDLIHLSHAGHGMIAAALLPRVMQQAGRRNQRPAGGEIQKRR